MFRCSVCKEMVRSYTMRDGKCVCTSCMSKMRKQDILEKASKSDDCAYFKEWTSKDRTTAFFESFGRYVKKPNKRDFMTVYHIWLWAVHDDKALAETIRYTFKWAKMTIHEEYAKWNS